MKLGKVIGNIVSTIKNEELCGAKLLIIQPLDEKYSNQGKPLIALDSVNAGVGDVVIWCRGKEASFPFTPNNVPTDCTITGIVDEIIIPK